jgi:hypothetical protein
MRTRATTITAGSGPLRCAAAGGARSSASGDGSVCRFRLAVSALGGLGGAGHWSALAASRPGLRKVRLCEGGSWLSRRLACSVRCRQSQETHEFYAASASVLDMPRVWGFLAVVSSLACRQGGTLRLRKAFTSCQEVTYRSCCEASTSVATAACSARHESCTPGKSTTL